MPEPISETVDSTVPELTLVFFPPAERCYLEYLTLFGFGLDIRYNNNKNISI